MVKAAPLIILSQSNLAEETMAVDTTLVKESHGKMSLPSATGSALIKTTPLKLLAQPLWCTLVKTSMTIVLAEGRCPSMTIVLAEG